jgi:redox-sensitive bicupin YhaK (pirin superfamily)
MPSAFMRVCALIHRSSTLISKWVGAKAALPNEYRERAIYVAAGAVEVVGERHETGC